jgi:hypothetical protein
MAKKNLLSDDDDDDDFVEKHGSFACLPCGPQLAFVPKIFYLRCQLHVPSSQTLCLTAELRHVFQAGDIQFDTVFRSN